MPGNLATDKANESVGFKESMVEALFFKIHEQSTSLGPAKKLSMAVCEILLFLHVKVVAKLCVHAILILLQTITCQCDFFEVGLIVIFYYSKRIFRLPGSTLSVLHSRTLGESVRQKESASAAPSRLPEQNSPQRG